MISTADKVPESVTPQGAEKKRSTWMLWLMIAIFAAPNLAIIYYHYSGDRPDFGQTNKGLLISPMVKPQTGAFTKLDGSSYNLLEKVAGKWALLMVTGADCQAVCQKSIYHMRQVRRALSVDRSRVERVLVVTNNDLPSTFTKFLTDYPLMNIVGGPENEVQSLVQQLSALAFKPETTLPVEGTIYLIDPKGRLILAYPEGIEPKDLLKDLRRLLKVSQLG